MRCGNFYGREREFDSKFGNNGNEAFGTGMGIAIYGNGRESKNPFLQSSSIYTKYFS